MKLYIKKSEQINKKMAATKAVVFDFDDTLTITQASKALDSNAIFGDHERILRIVRFLRKLRALNVDLYICSGSKKDTIEIVLDKLRETGYDLDSSIFKEIKGKQKTRKYEFIDTLIKYSIVVFIDDNQENYKNLNSNVSTIEMDESIKGMTADDEYKIMEELSKTPKKQKILQPQSVFGTPKTPGELTQSLCVSCGIRESYGVCGMCGTAAYCGVSCQREDWTNGGHSNYCLLSSHSSTFE